MPVYKVIFKNNSPVSATEVAAETYSSLKELETSEGVMSINWYIVQADNAIEAQMIAEKVVYQIWGDMLAKRAS
jgi:hypothetical protein